MVYHGLQDAVRLPCCRGAAFLWDRDRAILLPCSQTTGRAIYRGLMVVWDVCLCPGRTLGVMTSIVVTDIPRSKRWQIAPQAPADFIRSLRPHDPLVAQSLYNRGLTDRAAVSRFLDEGASLTDPFALAGVSAAVDLIRRAVAAHERVVVYGDYDVDGVTAVAVLVETLRALGATVEPYIPSREDEGYGLNRDALRSLRRNGACLLITVDCGMRSLAEVAFAREIGLSVIVTDHHRPGEHLPSADVVVNPKHPEDVHGLGELAGVGVAFQLARALMLANHEVPLPTTQRELATDDLLDLVALGTVADMVALAGENHILVSRGLRRINAAQRPGLSALMGVAGIAPGKVTTKTIGFVLAPRLNAAGRLGEAMTALNLLLAPDMGLALDLARELDELNLRRREMTQDAQDIASSLLSFGPVTQDGGTPPLIFVASDQLAPGIVGLAASRLLDEYYRPSVVISIDGEFSKGSARSIPEFHITEALDSVRGLLERYGGHAAAAGFTIRTERLPELESRLADLAIARLGEQSLVPTLQVDAETPLAALSEALYSELERLQPFGFGNPIPIFVSRCVPVLDARAVGDGRHLKLVVGDGGHRNDFGHQNALGRRWDAIAFRQGHWFGKLPARVDLAFALDLNEWNGRTNLQLNVQDIRVSEGVRTP